MTLNNFGPASVAYVAFFMLAAFLVVPRRSAATRIAVGVLLVTYILEFLQLWHPPRLQAIRSTFLGASLLGTSFSWWDFAAYVVGGWCRGRNTTSSCRGAGTAGSTGNECGKPHGKTRRHDHHNVAR